MAAPPSEVGELNEMDAWVSPRSAVTPVGAPATVGGEITSEKLIVAVTPNSSVTVIVRGYVP